MLCWRRQLLVIQGDNAWWLQQARADAHVHDIRICAGFFAIVFDVAQAFDSFFTLTLL